MVRRGKDAKDQDSRRNHIEVEEDRNIGKSDVS